MPNKIIRSPLFYVGDKYKLLTEIKPKFPTVINRFIEPFSGGGSVFLNVSANEFLLNDIDTHVFSLHDFLIKHSKTPNKFFKEVEEIIYEYRLSRSYKEDIVPDELKAKYRKTYYAKFNKENFEKLKSDFNNEAEINLYKFYVLLIYGFNRMIRFNSSGKYNLAVGNVDFNHNVVTALNNYFEKVKGEKIKWYNLDYADFLERTAPEQCDFLYFDPPYLITCSEYNKLWNEQNEKRLVKTLDELNKKNIRFACSNIVVYKGKENKIFNDWAKDYNVIPIKSNYISYHDNSIKAFTEVLVTNYE
jgi:DNA adenine methylase